MFVCAQMNVHKQLFTLLFFSLSLSLTSSHLQFPSALNKSIEREGTSEHVFSITVVNVPPLEPIRRETSLPMLVDQNGNHALLFFSSDRPLFY